MQNYVGATTEQADEGDDSDTWSYTSTPDLATLRVFDGDEDGMFVVLGGRVLPGEREDDTWVFSWSDALLSRYEDQLKDYVYRYEEETTETLQVRLYMDGPSVTGQVRRVRADKEAYEESDLWPEDPYYTEVPSGRYLMINNESVYNKPQKSDCDGDLCRLSILYTETTTRQFTAVHSSLSPDETLELDAALTNVFDY